MSSFSSFNIFSNPFVDNKRVRKYINTKFHGMSKHEINNFHTNVCFQTVSSHTMKYVGKYFVLYVFVEASGG